MRSATRWIAAAAVVPCALVVAGCGKTISASDLENKITANIEAQAKQTVKVNCPGSTVTVKKGKVVNCTVTLKDGRTVAVIVTLQDDWGRSSTRGPRGGARAAPPAGAATTTTATTPIAPIPTPPAATTTTTPPVATTTKKP
jgi:hypothetical protein